MTASRRQSPGWIRASRTRRTTALLLGLGAATALLLGAGLAPAAAHDGLVSTSPAADSTVDTAPPEVELRFSGPPLPLGTEVVVAGPDGLDIAAGPAEIRDTAVVQQLAETARPGRYTVQWRSTSSDGHPLSGAYTFTVTGSGPPPAPAAAPLPEVPAAPLAETASAERSDGTGATIAWAAAGVVVLGALGVLLAPRLRGRA